MQHDGVNCWRPLDSYRETLDLKYDHDETVSEALRHYATLVVGRQVRDFSLVAIHNFVFRNLEEIVIFEFQMFR